MSVQSDCGTSLLHARQSVQMSILRTICAALQSSATATQFSEAVSDAFSCVVLLKRYPKAVIEVHVTVMEAGGSELAVVMMAASLALCDAGIEMTGIVSAASVVRRPLFPIPLMPA